MRLSTPLLRQRNRHVPVTEAQVEQHKLDTRPVLSSYVGEAKVSEDWLEVPIADGWIAAYRLAHVGDKRIARTKILELRVFPDEGDRTDGPPGEWSASLLGKRVAATRQFSFDRLRRSVTEKSFNSALAAIRENVERKGPAALAFFGYPASQHDSSHEGRGAGRPGLQRTFYAQVAVNYDKIEHNSRREPGTSTREILRRRFYPTASIAAIGKWLSTARKQGFLTPVSRGQRGSRATKKAHELLQSRSARKPR